MTPATLSTPRLWLRPWKEADTEPFVALNADPRVCEFYPVEAFSRSESLGFIARVKQEMARYGFGLWALELRDTGQFIGYTGLKHLRSGHPLYPDVEAGWRLAPQFWGQGYATEAGREALRYGLGELALPRIVAFTAVPNRRSQRVMQRIGMRRAPEMDFQHPALAPGHPLRAHVTYVAEREKTIACE